MKSSILKTVIASVAILCAAPTLSFGLSGTYQDWQFATSGSPAPADPGMINPYGSSTATIGTVGNPESGPAWIFQDPSYGTNTGYWNLGGSGAVLLDIAGLSSAEPEGVDLQIVQWYNGDNYNGALSFVGTSQEFTFVGRIDLGSVPGGRWVQDSYHLDLPQSSSLEFLVLSSPGGSLVDRITVTTVPEPSVVVLLGAAVGLAALARRGRAKPRK